MAATPEAKVKARVRKILDAAGVYWCSPVGSGYGNAGVPDLLACVAGFWLAIECKAGKGTTTALQDAHIERIRRCGGIALVLNENNLQELENALCALKNLRPLLQ